MSSPNQTTIKYNGILYKSEAECIIARDGYMTAYHGKDQQYKDKIITEAFCVPFDAFPLIETTGIGAWGMAEEKITENEKDIIRISGELKLINQKLDNHVFHISAKIDTIFKIVWTISFMILGLLLKAVYSVMAG